MKIIQTVATGHESGKHDGTVYVNGQIIKFDLIISIFLLLLLQNNKTCCLLIKKNKTR